MNRWLTLWLVIILGLPILGTLVLTVAYQVLLESVSFYPFWLTEVYIFLWFPAALLVARLVYWGKRYPIRYFSLTLVLLIVVMILGTWKLMDDSAPIIRERLILKGIQNELLVTSDNVYRFAYVPYDFEQIVHAMRKEHPVDVYRLKGKKEILSFDDPAFSRYSPSDRLLNLVVGLVSSGTFALLFINILGAWTRQVDCLEDQLIFSRWWGRKIAIPLKEVVLIQLDQERKEVSVETEEMVVDLPCDPGMEKVLLKAVERGELVGSLPNQWVRRRQYEEVSIVNDSLVIKHQQERLAIPFSSVVEITWDGVIRLIDEEEAEYLITDSRYADKAWFNELVRRIQSSWKKERLFYIQEVDPLTGIESFLLK